MPEACGDKLQARTRQHVLPCLQVSLSRMYFTCRLICAPLDKVIAQFGDKILLCHKLFFFFFPGGTQELLQPHWQSQSHLLTSADPQAIPRSLAVLEILLLPGPRMSHSRRQRLPSSVLHGMPFNLRFSSCPMRQTGQKFPVSVFHRHITSVCVCVYKHTRA